MSAYCDLLHPQHVSSPCKEQPRLRHSSPHAQGEHPFVGVAAQYGNVHSIQPLFVSTQLTGARNKQYAVGRIRVRPIQALSSEGRNNEQWGRASGGDQGRDSAEKAESYEASVWDSNGERWRRRRRGGNTAVQEPRTAVQEPSQEQLDWRVEQARQKQARQNWNESRKNGPAQQPNVREYWSDEDEYKRERGWDDDEPAYGPFVFWNPLLRQSLQSFQWAFPVAVFFLPALFSNPVCFLLLPGFVLLMPPVRTALGAPLAQLWSTLLGMASRSLWEPEASTSQRSSATWEQNRNRNRNRNQNQNQNQNQYAARARSADGDQPGRGFWSKWTKTRDLRYDDLQSTDSWDRGYPGSASPRGPPAGGTGSFRPSDWFRSPPEQPGWPRSSGAQSTDSGTGPSGKLQDEVQPSSSSGRSSDWWDRPGWRSEEGWDGGWGGGGGGSWGVKGSSNDWTYDGSRESGSRGQSGWNAPDRRGPQSDDLDRRDFRGPDFEGTDRWVDQSRDLDRADRATAGIRRVGKVKLLPAPGEGEANREVPAGGPQRGPYYSRVSVRVRRQRGSPPRSSPVLENGAGSRRAPRGQEEPLGRKRPPEVRPGWEGGSWGGGDWGGQERADRGSRGQRRPEGRRALQQSIMSWQKAEGPLPLRVLFMVFPFLRSWGGFL